MPGLAGGLPRKLLYTWRRGCRPWTFTSFNLPPGLHSLNILGTGTSTRRPPRILGNVRTTASSLGGFYARLHSRSRLIRSSARFWPTVRSRYRPLPSRIANLSIPLVRMEETLTVLRHGSFLIHGGTSFVRGGFSVRGPRAPGSASTCQREGDTYLRLLPAYYPAGFCFE